jgi:hypothetical protein
MPHSKKDPMINFTVRLSKKTVKEIIHVSMNEEEIPGVFVRNLIEGCLEYYKDEELEEQYFKY